MSICYHVESGEFHIDNPDGYIFAHGYSGLGELRNRPDACSLLNGPIPKGWYRLGAVYDCPINGPSTISLHSYYQNTMYGRGGFVLRGGYFLGVSSYGSIVMPDEPRQKIARWVASETHETLLVY